MSLSPEDKDWIASTILIVTTEAAAKLEAHIERVETSLLTEFHKWARPAELKLRSYSPVPFEERTT